MITISGTMENVVFDGKWTTQTEWKSSSWNELRSGDSVMELRTAHQGNFIYVLVDYVTDATTDESSDKAVICLTDENEISKANNDFCFVADLQSDNGYVYEVDSLSGLQNPLDQDVKGFVAVGGVSDSNDRYTDIPHTSYEFKIPTDIVGRSDSYGLFISVYDSTTEEFFVWPDVQRGENELGVVPPDLWGQIISPDKSLPEFDLPLLILLPSFALVFYLTRTRANHGLN